MPRDHDGFIFLAIGRRAGRRPPPLLVNAADAADDPHATNNTHTHAPTQQQQQQQQADAPLPLYDRVAAEHVVPGMRALLTQLHAEIDALEGSVVPTWPGLVEPLERLTDRHQRTWGVVGHLKVRACVCVRVQAPVRACSFNRARSHTRQQRRPTN